MPLSLSVVVLLSLLWLQSVPLAPRALGALSTAKHGAGHAKRGAVHSNLALLQAVGAEARSVRAKCPWTSAAEAKAFTPAQLAAQVLSHMRLSEKLAMVNLVANKGYENLTFGVPRLCIPRLSLQDGPNGLAYNDTGVTQLPASLGIAASFDAALSYRYGQIIGEEARGQGIDVVQGPNLNVDRVPESGRGYEGYGEDPSLISAMGVSVIEGIQSKGVMAQAKHFTAYTQETDRIALDQVISERALQEIYLAPFRAAVVQGHVASLMCSYGKINGVLDCGNPKLYKLLDSDWNFTGFVRSDLAAVTSTHVAQAFAAGLDLIKPAAPGEIVHGLQDNAISEARLDDAVKRVLTEMFAYHLIEHPRKLRVARHVAGTAHALFARQAAEASMVLLKNAGAVLPLSPTSRTSIALIGADASTDAATAGNGGAHVIPPFITTPLRALVALAGSKRVRYVSGGTSISALPSIPARDLSNVHLTKARALLTNISTPGKAANEVGAIGTGPLASKAELDRWTGSLKVPTTGLYDLSLTDHGDAWLSLNGHSEIASTGVHGKATWVVAVWLNAGQHYQLALGWYPRAIVPTPVIGLGYESALIQKAVQLARHSKVAVVFARDYSSEAFDRPNLSLPGSQDALIRAVAAVNHNTVVVLNTGGAVLMPWLSKVKAVLEAWYPGEEDGSATAAVLFGKFDPAGHLPVTFPAATSQTPAHSALAWPGVDGVVNYTEGLDVGYRYYDTHELKPLFPFGYGLSYTKFSLSNLQLGAAGSNSASVVVTNTGKYAGSEVVQAYLSFPPAAGEPPKSLIAFAHVSLARSTSKEVDLTWPASAFSCYLGGKFVTVPGTYSLSVGDSSASLDLSGQITIGNAQNNLRTKRL